MAYSNNNIGDRNSGDLNSGDRNSGDLNSGDRNSGDRNSGDWNSGDWNSGSWNSGDRNSGYGNSGNGNSGDRNSGDWNSGDWNSGYWNSGYRNSGYGNSGNGSSGSWNSGDRNSGYGNSCNRSAGIFCNKDPKVYLFNKPTDLDWDDIEHPDLSGIQLTEWIPESKMSIQEKKDNSTFHTTGGYLKVKSYKEAWAEFWEKTDKANKDKILNLPNFDAEVFEEITGINVNKKDSCDGKVVTMEDGKKYRLSLVD